MMNHRSRAEAAAFPCTAPTRKRSDFRTRDIVNQAIAALPAMGIGQVAQYLADMNVSPAIAIRVLAPPAPQCRRDEAAFRGFSDPGT